MSRVLGLDHGTGTTGWGLLDITPTDSGLKEAYISHGFITRPEGLKYPATIKFMVDEIRNLLALSEASFIALEAPKDNRGFKTTQMLTELLGSIKYLLMSLDYGFLEIPPSSMKLAVTGYGWSSKEEVAAEAAKRLGLRFEDIVKIDYYKTGIKAGQIKNYILDGSDALGLALAFIPYIKRKDGLLDYDPRRTESP